MMFLLVLLVLLSFAAALAWAGMCNHSTYKQRIELINFIALQPYEDQNKYYEAFRSVSYEQHMWKLFFLQPPLYPELLAEPFAKSRENQRKVY